MKGKKKKSADVLCVYSSSSTSDGSESLAQTSTNRRSSDRLKRLSRSNSSSRKVKNTSNMVDSAYDGDDDSITAGSSTDSTTDPYSIDLMENVPSTVSSNKVAKKKTPKRKVKPSLKKHVSCKSSTPNSHVPTSTPVMEIHSKNRFVGEVSTAETPEVTPILPVASSSERSNGSSSGNMTPYNRRSTRKRPHKVDSDTPTLPTQLNSISLGDSGIGMSPISKKKCAPIAKEVAVKQIKPKRRQISSKQKNTENCHVLFMDISPTKKRDVLSLKSSNSNIIKDKKINSKSNNDSCFGFFESNVSTVLGTPPSGKKSSKFSSKARPKPRKMFCSKSNYRVTKEMSSDTPLEETNSQESQVSSDCNGPIRCSTPPLFSDDMFSPGAENIELNKSSLKPYKANKTKKSQIIQEGQKMSRLDVWATNFNMEIADIEKFELNIE